MNVRDTLPLYGSELTERNLGSLGAIATFVERKRRGSGAGEAGRPRHVV